MMQDMNLNLFSTYIMYVATITCVLSIMIVIGKFFHRKPFRQVYDYINNPEEAACICIFYLNIICTVLLLWLGLLFDVRGLVMMGIVSSLILNTVGLIILVITCTASFIVPGIQRVHADIVRKQEGK